MVTAALAWSVSPFVTKADHTGTQWNAVLCFWLEQVSCVHCVNFHPGQSVDSRPRLKPHKDHMISLQAGSCGKW